MIIETGKRYVSRSGSITDPLEDNSGDSMRFAFGDPETGATYMSNGTRHIMNAPHDQDLIREFRGEIEAVGPSDAEVKDARWSIPVYALWSVDHKRFCRRGVGLVRTWIDPGSAQDYMDGSSGSHLIINLETGETVE